jgi:hypothetical protein
VKSLFRCRNGYVSMKRTAEKPPKRSECAGTRAKNKKLKDGSVELILKRPEPRRSRPESWASVPSLRCWRRLLWRKRSRTTWQRR